MKLRFVNIHTHRPTGQPIELQTTGIHPWEAGKKSVESLIGAVHEVQAIGEIGLDAAKGPAMEIQLACFREQLQLARENDLPVVLHCVRTFESVMVELSRCRPRAVIFHGFVGSPQQAQRALAAGYYLSFGERTFHSPKTAEALRLVPDDRLFIETDESTISIEEMYAQIARLRGVEVATLQRHTLENYERIFGKING